MRRGDEREKTREVNMLYKDVEVQRRIARKEKKKGVWGEGDDKLVVLLFFCHTPPSLCFWWFHLPL